MSVTNALVELPSDVAMTRAAQWGEEPGLELEIADERAHVPQLQRLPRMRGWTSRR
jgi:hypothetical protein